jgi:YD repeat-containing protein
MKSFNFIRAFNNSNKTMKKSFKLLILIALGAGLVTLNACKEEPLEDPIPTISCYLTSFSEEGDAATYTLDDDNKVVSALTNGETTTFTYDVDGRLATADDGSINAVFVYDGADKMPNRINITAQGQTLAYMLIKSANDNITEIETHFIDPNVGDIAYSRNSHTYTGNNLATIILEQFDLNTQQFVEAGRVENITNDGKTNPLARSLAYFFMNFENPTVLGASNMTGGSVTTDGTTSPLVIQYTYNENDYPLTAAQIVDGDTTNLIFGYSCK